MHKSIQSIMINADILIDDTMEPIYEEHVNHTYSAYDAYIRQCGDLSPNRIRATLSTQMFPRARKAIIEFFSDPTVRAVTLGYSSGSLCRHILYQGDDHMIYVLHCSYGEIKNAFYFTRSEMCEYFEDFEDEMPEYQDPPIVKDILASDA